MKIKNIESGMTLQYKGGDQDEKTFSAGELVIVEIVFEALSTIFVKSATDGDDRTSQFSAEFLRPAVQQEEVVTKKNTVAGYMPASGFANERAVLAARIVTLPATDEFSKAANTFANKFVSGDITGIELSNIWGKLMVQSENLNGLEIIQKSRLITEYIVKNEV